MDTACVDMHMRGHARPPEYLLLPCSPATCPTAPALAARPLSTCYCSVPLLLPYSPSPSSEAAEYLKLVCKIFWSATYMCIPDVLLQPEQFAGWMNGIHLAVTKAVPVVGGGGGGGR